MRKLDSMAKPPSSQQTRRIKAEETVVGKSDSLNRSCDTQLGVPLALPAGTAATLNLKPNNVAGGK